MATSMETFNWDQLPVKTGATADPAAGANPAAITVPAGKKWLLLGLYEVLVTDATVISRRMLVSVARDGTNPDLRLYNSTNLTATVSWEISWSRGLPAEVSSSVYVMVPFPALGLELPAGATITITFVNLQAADNAGVLRYAYKEMPA